MRRIIWSINLTLDGCDDHALAIADEVYHHYAADLMDHCEGVILGRATYEMMAEHWPIADHPPTPRVEAMFARKLNTIRKYVVSKTLTYADWEHTTILPGELAAEMAKIKNQPGKDLVVLGSPDLAHSLVAAKLVDEYHLVVQPFFAGRGPRLFEELPEPLKLKFLEARPFKNGAVLMRYAPA